MALREASSTDSIFRDYTPGKAVADSINGWNHRAILAPHGLRVGQLLFQALIHITHIAIAAYLRSAICRQFAMEYAPRMRQCPTLAAIREDRPLPPSLETIDILPHSLTDL